MIKLLRMLHPWSRSSFFIYHKGTSNSEPLVINCFYLNFDLQCFFLYVITSVSGFNKILWVLMHYQWNDFILQNSSKLDPFWLVPYKWSFFINFSPFPFVSHIKTNGLYEYVVFILSAFWTESLFVIQIYVYL